MLLHIKFRIGLVAMTVAFLAVAAPVPEDEVVASGEPCKDDNDCPPVRSLSVSQISI